LRSRLLGTQDVVMHNEAFRLQVRYDKLDNSAQCRVTLSDDGVDAVNENDAVQRAAASGKPTCAHVMCPQCVCPPAVCPRRDS
jgi:hypothetical protein